MVLFASFLWLLIALMSGKWAVERLALRRLRKSWGGSVRGDAPDVIWGTLGKQSRVPRATRYGETYVMWLRFLEPICVLGRTDDARTFYKKMQATTTKDLSVLGHTFAGLMGECQGVKSGADWNRLHNIFAPFYSPAAISCSVDRMDRIVRNGIERFRRVRDGSANRTFSVALETCAELEQMMLHVLAFVAYGSSLQDTDRKELEAMYRLHKEVARSMGSRWAAVPLFRFLPVKSNRVFWELRQRWHDFNRRLLARGAAQRCKGDQPHGPDAEGVLLSVAAAQERGDVALKERELFDTLYEVLLFNVAITHDALSAFLRELAANPAAQELVRAEIKQVFRGDIAEQDWATNDDVKQLKYTRAASEEAARMHPSVPLSFPEKITQPATFAGSTIQVPAGTQVCIDTQHLNRSASSGWDDPGTFRPERFLPKRNQPTRTASEGGGGTKFFNRFGRGPRQCMGSHFASTFVVLAAARVVEQFNLSVHHRQEAAHGTKSGESTDVSSVPFLDHAQSPQVVFHRR